MRRNTASLRWTLGIVCCGVLAGTPGPSLGGHAPATTQPAPEIFVVPVYRARCLALHPTLPLLLVGREADRDGKNLVSFGLAPDGRPQPGSRQEHRDGLYEAPPVPDDAEYGVADIAFHPSRPEVYVAAAPKRAASHRADTNTAVVAALALDEGGRPGPRLTTWQPPSGRAVVQLTCDRHGRFLYLAEQSGVLHAWPLDEEVPGPLQFETRRKHPPHAERARWLRARADARRFTVKPELKLDHWRYVPEWNRGYAVERTGRRAAFLFGEDGLSVVTFQLFGTPARVPGAPAVSVRHRKLYAPHAEGSQLAIYSLTAEGRLTGLPRLWPVEPVRLVQVDETNERLYAVGRTSLAIYHLDAAGYPQGEPQRVNPACGEIRDALASSRSGALYLACSKPSAE